MKIRCSRCNGSGYEKKEIIKCKYCLGKTCINCNSTGLKQQPYETCYGCFGSGEIENKVTIQNIVKKDNIININDDK